jgi:hypothetical protein
MSAVDPLKLDVTPAAPDDGSVHVFALQTAQRLLAAADAIDGGTATAADQRSALSLCCRTHARLIRYLLADTGGP